MEHIKFKDLVVNEHIFSLIENAKYKLNNCGSLIPLLEEKNFDSYEQVGEFVIGLLYGCRLAPQLYYVKFTDNKYSYLNIDGNTGELYVYDNLCSKKGSRCKFTLEEIRSFDKGYEQFCIKVKE